jgi:hypothetical protein
MCPQELDGGSAELMVVRDELADVGEGEAMIGRLEPLQADA